MQNYKKKIWILFFIPVLAVVLCGKPVLANVPTAAQVDPGLMTADFFLVRPVGTVATVTGFVIFLVSSPFSALGGNSHEAWESLVASPANYTFHRPLGVFPEKY